MGWTGFEALQQWVVPGIIIEISPIKGTRLSGLTFNITTGDTPKQHFYCQANDSNIVDFVLNTNTGQATNIVYLPKSFLPCVLATIWLVLYVTQLSRMYCLLE